MQMKKTSNEISSLLPELNIPRSSHHVKARHTTTTNTGDFTPIYVDPDMFPGKTVRIREIQSLIRLQTPINPTMDIAWATIMGFCQRNIMLWDNFNKQMGENEEGAWAIETEYLTPIVKIPSTDKVKKGTFSEKIGMPINVGSGTQNVGYDKLILNMYLDCYNCYIRDQNLIAPIAIDKTDADIEYKSDDPAKGGKLLKMAKLDDYFTELLPDAQKGDPVQLPIGSIAPVIGTGEVLGLTQNGTSTVGTHYWDDRGIAISQASVGKKLPFSTGGQQSGYSNGQAVGVTKDPKLSGLQADLSGTTSAPVRTVDLAWKLQELRELDAWGGTRDFELIKSEYGVDCPLDELKKPKLIYIHTFPIDMYQVDSTANTSDGTVGETGAVSLTNNAAPSFTYTSTKFEQMMFCLGIRTENRYGQGIPRYLNRRRRFDRYTPKLAKIGFTAKLKSEIYADGSDNDALALGFSEAWREMKCRNALLTGEFSPNYEQPLNTWNYGTILSKHPTLSQEFIEETVENVDRTIYVQSKISDQWKVDVEFDMDFIMSMPDYNLPTQISAIE